MLKTGWNYWFFLQPEARPYDWSCQTLLTNWDPWPSSQCHPAAFLSLLPSAPPCPQPALPWLTKLHGGWWHRCVRSKRSSEITTPSKGPSVKSDPDMGVGLRGELEIWEEHPTQHLAKPITWLSESQPRPYSSFPFPLKWEWAASGQAPPPLGITGLGQGLFVAQATQANVWGFHDSLLETFVLVCLFVHLILSLLLLKMELGVAVPLLFAKCQIFSRYREKHKDSESRPLLHEITRWHTMAIKGIK